MKFKVKRIMHLILFALVILTSCKKYLDVKSNENLATPETLDDLRAILNTPTMNEATQLTNVGTDEYFLSYTNWNAVIDLYKNGYVWNSKLNDFQDWSRQYNTILYANTVLDNLPRITSKGGGQEANSIKGKSLFFRAYAFYQVAQLYCLQYDKTASQTDLGIPLRLTSDFNVPSARSTIQQTYDQIINDLSEALKLLPNTLPNSIGTKSQPTRVSAFAMLSRVYLQMEDYSKAKDNADSCLKLYNNLIDFNDPTYVDTSSAAPIVRFNPEIIFYTYTGGAINSTPAAKIDSNLYKQFSEDDLRKIVFFRLNSDNTSYRFKGSYNSGSVDLFNGLATDEIILIHAECNARLNNVNTAVDDLNSLLNKRWKKGTYSPISPSIAADQALSIVLQERKKELIYRGIRWSDLRRLNKDSRFAITISRDLNGINYSLPPNDLRYVLLIPNEVTSVTNLQQNSR